MFALNTHSCRPKIKFLTRLFQFYRIPSVLLIPHIPPNERKVLKTKDIMTYLDCFLCFHRNWEHLLDEGDFKLAERKCQFAKNDTTLRVFSVRMGFKLMSVDSIEEL